MIGCLVVSVKKRLEICTSGRTLNFNHEKDLRGHVPWKNLWANDFWGTPMDREQSHKSWRPLTVATFRLNFALGKLDTFGYHLVNLVLHGAVTVLYHDLCVLVTAGKSGLSAMAAIMFALHPVRKKYHFMRGMPAL